MGEYTLSNPVVELSFDSPPSKAFIAAFIALTLFGVLGVGWVYVMWLPSVVGFQTALLIGVFVIMLGLGDN